MERCDALARHSELAGGLTRVFLSREARAATEQVLGWMREAGMEAKLDAIGNAAARYEGERSGLPCLMLGSHLDTVRDAGKYDGMLGVISAIECVHDLHYRKKRLPFAIEIIGFGDEEGVRFGTTLLGSRAVAGTSTAMRSTPPTPPARACPLRSRSSACRRSAFPSSRGRGPSARLRRAAHRARAGARGGRLARRRGHGDQRVLPPARHVARRGRARRHRADEAAPRCARGRGAMRPRRREHRQRTSRARRHGGTHRSQARRDQRHPGRSCFSVDVRAPQDALRQAASPRCGPRSKGFPRREAWTATSKPCRSSASRPARPG